MMKRVLCVGNRYLYPDCSALLVYDEALKSKPWQELEWIDGGLGGLNLISYFENIKNILIIDYMPSVQHLQLFSLESILNKVNIQEYSHENALYYLLKSLSVILEKVPSVSILSCNPEKENYIEETFLFVEHWSQSV